MPESRWKVIANSAGFYGVDGIAQEAADVHCERFGHTPAVYDSVAVGSVARCTGCGRSIALLLDCAPSQETPTGDA